MKKNEWNTVAQVCKVGRKKVKIEVTFIYNVSTKVFQS